jgi:preprotein translocase subunit SecG
LAVLAFGAIKARLIVQEFMEVRTAPRWLRRLTDAWLAGLFITVLVLYLS